MLGLKGSMGEVLTGGGHPVAGISITVSGVGMEGGEGDGGAVGEEAIPEEGEVSGGSRIELSNVDRGDVAWEVSAIIGEEPATKARVSVGKGQSVGRRGAVSCSKLGRACGGRCRVLAVRLDVGVFTTY